MNPLHDGTAACSYDTEILNSDADRASGIQRDEMRVKTNPYNRIIVLVGTIGPTVTFAESA